MLVFFGLKKKINLRFIFGRHLVSLRKKLTLENIFHASSPVTYCERSVGSTGPATAAVGVPAAVGNAAGVGTASAVCIAAGAVGSGEVGIAAAAGIAAADIAISDIFY